jgi:hypothetical protein
MEKSLLKNALIELYAKYYNKKEELVDVLNVEGFVEVDDKLFWQKNRTKIDQLHGFLYDLDQIIKNY